MDEIKQVITGDKAVSDKLKKEGIETDRQASGSWDSILEQLTEK